MLLYKNFTFPLNAYSHILYKDYGNFRHLHYGLFEQDNQSFDKAQQRATDFLFSHLPPCPCRILEIGIGLGITLSNLVKAGYDATGISPDANQINYAKNLHGENLPTFCERLEDFTDTQKFDLIIFQESAQYIDTETLFRKASSLLRDEGQIIIMDEISLHKSSEPGLPLIDDYISLSDASGFDIIERLDLSSQAAPTNAYLLDAVTRYREDLIRDLDLPGEQIDGLIHSLQNHLNKYRDGRYGYCFLQLKKKTSEQRAWITEWAHPENEAELLTLFSAAFGHEMPPELWRWKYQGLDTLGAMVRRDNRPVAFYGGLPRAVRLFGSSATAVQIGDVMIHPQERGILTRKGPFYLAASNFLERFVGQGKTFSLAFGFPSERAYRLGALLGLYEQIGEIMRVAWPALKTRPSLKTSTRILKPDQHTTVDLLWNQMAEAMRDQVIGVRDWNYLQHRYLSHPTINYQVFLVSSRLTGSPIGIFVVRILEDSVELLDLIAPPKHMPILVHNVRRLAWNLDKSLAYAWITAQHAPLLAGETGEITSTDIVLPNFCWTPGISASELQDRWWLMGGDTDFH
ncbi:methyltransferase domain-containing protein [Methylobacter sp.]|uniref:methyltransferase domain-containing protein n=1 Tax=Methylobacter sp. TaxID=2051955 RepID=UPI002FDCE283